MIHSWKAPDSASIVRNEPTAVTLPLCGSGPENLVRVALARTATGTRSFGLLVRFREIEIAAVVPVMLPYPVAEVETGTGLVATLGRQIQANVCANQFFGPTTVGRIGVEDVTGRVLVEHTDAGHFLDFNHLHFRVVVGLAPRDFVLRERHVVIFETHESAFDVVDVKRKAHATPLPPGSEHEMLYE
jgi:hypothetical protein